MCLTVSIGLCACGFLGGSSQKEEIYTYSYTSANYYGNLTLNFTKEKYYYEGYTVKGSGVYTFMFDPLHSSEGTLFDQKYSQNGMDKYYAEEFYPFYLWVAQDRSYVMIGGLKFTL